MATNNITGDKLRSKMCTKQYLSGWDLIWGKPTSSSVDSQLTDSPIQLECQREPEPLVMVFSEKSV